MGVQGALPSSRLRLEVAAGHHADQAGRRGDRERAEAVPGMSAAYGAVPGGAVAALRLMQDGQRAEFSPPSRGCAPRGKYATSPRGRMLNVIVRRIAAMTARTGLRVGCEIDHAPTQPAVAPATRSSPTCASCPTPSTANGLGARARDCDRPRTAGGHLGERGRGHRRARAHALHAVRRARGRRTDLGPAAREERTCGDARCDREEAQRAGPAHPRSVRAAAMGRSFRMAERAHTTATRRM